MHIVFKSLHKYHVVIYLLQKLMVGVLVFLCFFQNMVIFNPHAYLC